MRWTIGILLLTCGALSACVSDREKDMQSCVLQAYTAVPGDIALAEEGRRGNPDSYSVRINSLAETCMRAKGYTLDPPSLGACTVLDATCYKNVGEDAPLVGLLDRWQGLFAGLLGFVAAILAVRFTLNAERRRSNRELTALRRSFGVEFRQCVLAALGAHQSLRTLALSPVITARMAESMTLLPEPIIYPASASRIGLLGNEAMDIAAMYNVLYIARGGVDRLQRHRTPDNIPSESVAAIANALLRLCTEAVPVLPRLKTHVAHIDQRDPQIIGMIQAEEAAWTALRQQHWPNLT